MAKLYEKLQKALTSYEDRPIEIITVQIFTESLFIVRGKEKRALAWHYILVPANNIPDLKAQKADTTIDITKFGRIVEYRNKRGEIKRMSGWGTDPPKMFEMWMNIQYDSASVDENVNLIYEKDDIRLCTMQRAIPQQLIGIGRYYHRQEQFHYIKLSEKFPSSLAHQAGLKNYDRIISLNGINIENDTMDKLSQRFNTQLHLPVQMLVCNPATYAHYKVNNKSLHTDLPTVQRLKPVYATLTTNFTMDKPIISIDHESFYVVQWKNSTISYAIPQSAICKSSEFIRVNDICFMRVKGHYRPGRIIFKGSYDECEKLKTHSFSSAAANIFDKLTNLFLKKTSNTVHRNMNCSLDFTDYQHVSLIDTSTILTSSKASQKHKTNLKQAQINIQNTNDRGYVILNNHGESVQQTKECVHTTLEQLPNELFFSLFNYLDTPDLYNAIWGLNSRIDNLFQSYENLCLTFNEKTDQLSMKSYASHIVRLIIDTSINCDFSQFPNLQTLILCDGNSKHLDQIQPNILPNLSHLSFLLGSKFTPPLQLINNIFSNKFPYLNQVNLGRIDDLTTCRWSTSPSLRFVSIHSNNPLIVSAILISCPNLDHLQLHFLNKHRNNVIIPSSSNHSLRRFTLWSHSLQCTLNDIDIILSYIPNVQHFYLQTVCNTSFIDLVNDLFNRLNRLSRFDCHVKEMINKIDRIHNSTIAHQLHYCFNRIKCIEEHDNFRIFATE